MEKGQVKVVTVKDLNKVSQKGTTYSVFNIEIEQNGVILKGKTLTFGEMTECKFKEGQEAEFTKTPDSYKEGFFEFKWGPEKKAWGGGGGGRQPENPKVRNVSFAMSYAKDLVVGSKIEISEVLAYADRILKWMNEKVDQFKV